jgi:hypothetical protein
VSGLTMPVDGKQVREEYDETDPAAVETMRAKFDAIVSQSGHLAYATTADKGTETIHKGEFPAEQAEVVVARQYAGG